MIIKKLLFKNREKGQFYVAVLGSIFGTLFLLSSIHYLIRINEFGSGEEILGPNTLVVQKKVTNSSALKVQGLNFLTHKDSNQYLAPLRQNKRLKMRYFQEFRYFSPSFYTTRKN